MALAILHWEAAEKGHYRFKIDIGTNKFYKFNIGRSKDARGGMSWVAEITHTTPFKSKKNTFILGDSSEEVMIPNSYFDKNNCYIQLISAKDQQGKSLAVSDIVKIPYALKGIDMANFGISSAASIPMSTLTFNPSRSIGQSQQEFSSQYSLEEILSNVAKAILPVAVNMITQGGSTSNDKTPPSPQSANIVGLLSTLLKALVPALPGLSKQSSFLQKGTGDNRFSIANSQFSNAMIFGIDDALLATLAGPIIKEGLQLLPQLINATQQHKLQVLQANNQLMSGLAGEVQRRLMMQQLLQNQSAAKPNEQTIDPAVLAQLLAQLQNQPPVSTVTPTTTPPVATAHSLSSPVAYTLSNNVLLTFENLELQKYIGKDLLILQKTDKTLFRIKINTPSTPKKPLPKAIYTFYFKGAVTKKIHFVKTFKKKDIIANAVTEFDFIKNELTNIPLQNEVEIFVEMRWQTTDRKEFKAVNSCNAVFVGTFFLQNQGGTVSQEKELNDMKVYRSFWNKIWQSPVTGKSKLSWILVIDLKYIFSISPEHNSNGITDSKLAAEPKDKDALIDTTTGKMKAGLELSLSELNKLLDGWDGEKPLDDEKLTALKNIDFARNNAAELIQHIKFRGKSYEQGNIWIVPIFKLFELTLSKIDSINECGYVNSMSPLTIKFPLPVSARVLGLKSNNN